MKINLLGCSKRKQKESGNSSSAIRCTCLELLFGVSEIFTCVQSVFRNCIHYTHSEG